MKGNKSADKSYSFTQGNSISPGKRSARKSLTETPIAEISKEDFEARIMDVDLRKPRSAYNYYLADMKNKEEDVYKSITEISKL